MKNFRLIALVIILSFNTFAAENISYSGRLVTPAGTPVVGPVNMKFDIVVDSDIKCTLTKSSVPLSNGVFNVSLDYGTTCNQFDGTLSKTIEAAYYNDKIPYIRVTDTTNTKTYPDQPIAAVPLAIHALTGGSDDGYNLSLEYSCADGEILKMNSSNLFVCAADDSGSGGTVSNVATGTGLTGGPITSTGTISIANDGVTATQLADNAVDTAAIVDANVTTAKLADDAVTTAKLADDAVTTAKLADDAVTTAKITDANVTTAKLADNSVTSDKLAAGAINASALGANSVSSSNIIDGTIVNADISGSAAIDYTKLDIANGEISQAKVSNLTSDLAAKLPLAGGTMSGSISMNGNNLTALASLGLNDATIGIITVQAPLSVTSYTWQFPSASGSNGQVLMTDGSGATSWTTVNTSSADGHSLDAADGTPTNALYVDNDGKVGIGTTAPDTNLEINTANSLGSTFTGTSAGEGLRVTQTNYTDGNYVSLLEGSYDNSSASAHSRIAARYTGSGSFLTFGTSNSYVAGITNEAMVIDPSGNLNVLGTVTASSFSGTASNADTLDSIDSTGFLRSNADDTMNSSLTITGSGSSIAGSSFSNGWLKLGNATTGIAMDSNEIYGTTGLIIGTLNDAAINMNTTNLNLNDGSVTASSFLYTSDKRLKENIQVLKNPLERIENLRGVSFNWKENGKKDIGFIAQEVEANEKELVTTSNNEELGIEDLKAVKYGNITALLVEAIKEIKNQIDNLFDASETNTRKFATLEKENKKLKDKLEKQEREFNQKLEAQVVRLRRLEEALINKN